MAGIKKEQSRPQKLPSKQPEGIGPDVIGKIETPKNKGCRHKQVYLFIANHRRKGILV